MRVAILSSEYPPFIFGGIGTFCQNLAEALTKLGVEVLVIAGSPEKYPRHTKTDDLHPIEIIRLPRGSIPPRHLWFQLRNMNSIKRELANCDLVHGQDSSSFPLLQSCKRSGLTIPWVITFHTNPQTELRLTIASLLHGGSPTDFGTYVVGFPSWDLTIRQHAKRADSLVSVSRNLREELCRSYGLNTEKVSVIPTCIDIEKLQILVDQRSHLMHTIRLFYAGRLYYRKGVLALLEIARCLTESLAAKNFELHMFGTGPLEGLCRSRISRYHLESIVKLRGFVSRKTLMTELTNSDIVCMPSFYEACPVSMIEAMAMGKPVVAFNLPYAREILSDESQLLSSTKPDFATKLAHLINSSEDRERLGYKMKLHAAKFDSVKIATSYRTIYDTLVS